MEQQQQLTLQDVADAYLKPKQPEPARANVWMHSAPVTRSTCEAYEAYLRHIEYLPGTGKRMALTFAEWQWTWLASGKYDQRGVGPDKYCMSRHGDKGDYAPGNVFIQPFPDNASQGQMGKPKSAAQRLKMQASAKARLAVAPPPDRSKSFSADGVVYPSLTEAAKACGISREAMHKRVKTGKPGYHYV